MTFSERMEFEVQVIKAAWRELWPRTAWLRDAVDDSFEPWLMKPYCDDDEEYKGEALHGFRIRFDTERMTGHQYIKLLNWAKSIGFDMFAPILTENWAQGASFSAAFILLIPEPSKREYLWEHRLPMNCEPYFRVVLYNGKAYHARSNN